MKNFFIRFLFGLLLMGVLLAGLFALTLTAIPTWGATRAEDAKSLPGDELTSNPTLRWTNAITVDVPPEKVWPWIAQIGDSRGGFYSYTFIENKVGALTGASDYQVVYTNASAVHPEWQDPQPGDTLIEGSLKVREVEAGRHLLADSIQPSPFLWIWGWNLEPIENGSATRLIVRFTIEVPDASGGNPVMNFMLNVGGFVMQQNMMQGIKLRAEGGSEPAWIESVEIFLWLAAFVTAIDAAILYLVRKGWRGPLVVAVSGVVGIFILTFVQPPLVIRFLLDGALIAALVLIGRKKTGSQEA